MKFPVLMSGLRLGHLESACLVKIDSKIDKVVFLKWLYILIIWLFIFIFIYSVHKGNAG